MSAYPRIMTIVGLLLLGFSRSSPAQVLAGLDVTRRDQPAEIVGYVGISIIRHHVAFDTTWLKDDERGRACSMGLRYEFTPRGVINQVANRTRRVQLFGVASVAAVFNSCDTSVDEDIPTGLARYFNAQGAIGGGIRVTVFDTPPLAGLVRLAVTQRRFFGTGQVPGQSALGLSIGFNLLMTGWLIESEGAVP